MTVFLLGVWQAYTLELEAEVAKLKEMNRELQKKQVCYLYEVKILLFQLEYLAMAKCLNPTLVVAGGNNASSERCGIYSLSVLHFQEPMLCWCC